MVFVQKDGITTCIRWRFLKLYDGWNFEIFSDNQDGEAVVPFLTCLNFYCLIENRFLCIKCKERLIDCTSAFMFVFSILRFSRNAIE